MMRKFDRLWAINPIAKARRSVYSCTNFGQLADLDGVSVSSLNFGAGSKHILLDRSGHIKKVMVGILSEADLKNELGGL